LLDIILVQQLHPNNRYHTQQHIGLSQILMK